MGVPTIERVVTVSGGAVKEPKNLRLRVGTLFEDAINLCGGIQGKVEKLIMGGPMMGMSQYTMAVPVVKGTSGILLLSPSDVSSGDEAACIRCGRCVKNCPMASTRACSASSASASSSTRPRRIQPPRLPGVRLLQLQLPLQEEHRPLYQIREEAGRRQGRRAEGESEQVNERKR
jgi:ferredoxin